MEEPKPQEPEQEPTILNEAPEDVNHDAIQPPKPSKKRWLWLGLVGLLIVAGLVYWFVLRDKDEPQASINSYDECVAAGYPVMESYPEQCAVPGGQTFTRQLSEEEQAALENKDIGIDTESPLVTEMPEGQPVEMIRLGDEAKLPNQTPNSFVVYMKDKLENNLPDMNGCVTRYSVYKISDINIAGGIGAADPNPSGEPKCGGGAGVTWYLQDGEWQQTSGYQSWPPCSWFEDAKIYSEFVSTCYVEENGEHKEIDNPNGSIDDVEI